MLEGGRPYKAVAQDCACTKMEENSIPSRNIINDNELRMLKQTKLELEQQLKGFNQIHV